MSPGAACPSSRIGSDSVSPSGRSRAVGSRAWTSTSTWPRCTAIRTSSLAACRPSLVLGQLVPDGQGRLHRALRHLLQCLRQAKDRRERRGRGLDEAATEPLDLLRDGWCQRMASVQGSACGA